MKIIFSRKAIQDLQRLRQFIAIHKIAADKIAKRLREAIASLSDFPLIGMQIKNKWGIPIRELIVDNYVIAYTVIDETIRIIQIWHGKENR